MLSLDDPAKVGESLTMFRKEVEAMQSFDHVNIVKLHYFDESALFID